MILPLSLRCPVRVQGGDIKDDPETPFLRIILLSPFRQDADRRIPALLPISGGLLILLYALIMQLFPVLPEQLSRYYRAGCILFHSGPFPLYRWFFQAR